MNRGRGAKEQKACVSHRARTEGTGFRDGHLFGLTRDPSLGAVFMLRGTSCFVAVGLSTESQHSQREIHSQSGGWFLRVDSEGGLGKAKSSLEPQPWELGGRWTRLTKGSKLPGALTLVTVVSLVSWPFAVTVKTMRFLALGASIYQSWKLRIFVVFVLGDFPRIWAS